MNISEQAGKYAEGKANEAITKAIAEAYIAGYEAGYKDREKEMPLEPAKIDSTEPTLYDDNGNEILEAEYVDLGLPSHTLWSADYNKSDGEILYLTYGEAACMNLPTEAQMKELMEFCMWTYDSETDCAKILGPNGNFITLSLTGRKVLDVIKSAYCAYFWIKDDETVKDKLSFLCWIQFSTSVKKVIDKCFVGYKLPIRIVRSQ